MFSYYGTKKKLAKHYPSPSYDTIIEPFCGAAMYSLHENNWEKNVILYDKYDKIFLAWDYLINHAEVSDIKDLPDLFEGLHLDSIQISPAEKALLGFYANPSSAVPKKTVSARGAKSWERHQKYLIDNLHKVKHWKIYQDTYLNIDNIEATWFIDPPYQFGGQYYHSSASNKLMDYDELREWSLKRKGEIIVCENSKADWMDFKPLAELNGQLHKTLEVIYHKNVNDMYDDYVSWFKKKYHGLHPDDKTREVSVIDEAISLRNDFAIGEDMKKWLEIITFEEWIDKVYKG